MNKPISSKSLAKLSVPIHSIQSRPANKILVRLESNSVFRAEFLAGLAGHPRLLPDFEIVLNEYAKSQARQSPPVVEKGRRIEQMKKSAWGWKRLEFVPCGSPRCRKNPDEHGPYWYSYRFIDGNWKCVYHGRQEPAAQPSLSIHKMRAVIEESALAASIDDSRLAILRTIAADLAGLDQPEADGLRDKALRLAAREEESQDRVLRERHRKLVEKNLRGQRLTLTERKEFERTSALLAGDH